MQKHKRCSDSRLRKTPKFLNLGNFSLKMTFEIDFVGHSGSLGCMMHRFVSFDYFGARSWHSSLSNFEAGF